MGISDRQRAAITRRKREARVDRDLQAERARLGLVMPTAADQVPHDPDLVGWFAKTAGSVRGENHVCIGCRPDGGLTVHPVYRHMLAATMPCILCGTRLETVVRQAGSAGQKKEKKRAASPSLSADLLKIKTRARAPRKGGA